MWCMRALVRSGTFAGHNIMLDNPEGFARATAAALSDHGQQKRRPSCPQ